MADFLLADGLCFAHGDAAPLFSNLSLRIGAERVALAGGNGVGKTTLLHLLTGQWLPDAGQVIRRGRHFHWPQQADAGTLVRDVAGGPLSPGLLSRHGLPPDLDPDRPLASLSGGQMARLRLAAIRHLAPDLLILDEPGHDLDRDGRALLIDLIAGWRGGLLLVSHDRPLLDTVDRILHLCPLGLRSHRGGWAAWEAAQAAERASARRALADADRDARQAAATAREAEARAARRARTGKRDRLRGSSAPVLLDFKRDGAEKAGATRRVQAERRSAAAAAARSDAASRLPPPLPPLSLAVPPTGLGPAQALVRVEGLALARDGRVLFQDVAFDLTGPARLAVTGGNGAGKTSLLDGIAGGLTPVAGRVVRAKGVRLARLDQRLTRTGTPLSLYKAAHPDADPGTAHAALARFGFRNIAAEQRLDQLSGGMLVRAHLCAVLAGPVVPNLLLLDEPTNHLDRDGRAALITALAAYDGAMILVSHDPEILAAIGVTAELTLMPATPPAPPSGTTGRMSSRGAGAGRT